MSELLVNMPLIAAVTAVAVAQVIKVPLTYLTSGKLDWSLLFSPGRMPSSHTAGMSALSTAIAFQEGLRSALFALAFLTTAIVMFDAAGVRRHAGEHAAWLNRLIFENHAIGEEARRSAHEEIKRLKEIIGHKPSEVLGGLVLGVVIGWFFARHALR
ncbi:MAG: divergent PAP2 family protein [Hydrogenibacillus sp.]|nr:divergent PAP2 family protein [Hydrogenibacillus sp.]